MSENAKLRCYILGAGSLPVQCAENLLARGYEILGVFAEEPMREWAESNGIPTFDPNGDLVEEFGKEAFDYLFSITYLSIIPDAVLALPERGAINFHDGPLPNYAGLNTPAWALINREETYGITWHWITAGIDKGDILKQRTFKVDEDEVGLTLNTKCFEAGIETFSELADELGRNEVTPLKQDFGGRVYFGKHMRPPAACLVRWESGAEEVSALVRALDFGSYENPLGAAKLLLNDKAFIVSKARVLDEDSSEAPGSVVRIADDSLVIATGDKNIAIEELKTVDGREVSLSELPGGDGGPGGLSTGGLDDAQLNRLSELNGSICKHEEFWVGRISDLAPASLPYSKLASEEGDSDSAHGVLALDIPDETLAELQKLSGEASLSDLLICAFGAFLARVGETAEFDIAYRHSELESELEGFESLFASHVPLHLSFDTSRSFGDQRPGIQRALEETRRRRTYLRDAFARFPGIASQRGTGFPITIEVADSLLSEPIAENGAFLFQISESGQQCTWSFDTASFNAEDVAAMRKQFSIFLEDLVRNPEKSIAEGSLLSEDELHQVLVEWNRTEADFPADSCVHQLFETQAERTPDEVAVVFEAEELTYRELNERSNQLAAHLRKLGVGPEVMVGIFVKRSLDLMVAIMGTLKAGGAYVPLDPEFPRDRIAFMIEDTEVPVLLTQDELVDALPPNNAKVVRLDADWLAIGQEDTTTTNSGVTPKNLAYAIYTSGSTGKPKGVLVEHHNVVNFFTGMDDRIEHDPPGVWLAVTSLSFDISVLELFWTLARGFKVVLYSEEDWKVEEEESGGAVLKHQDQKLDFNFFYWNLASDDGASNDDRYHLLLEGAKFADKNGFNAVWTPERHFHAFGGLYPNPSVTSAGLATITENVRLRAGSCVLPLHSPIRVAEEWSVVDNLSKGRVDIAFAAGWQPNDFALRPENHADRKNILFRDIEVVRRLWRGEAIDFPGPLGDDVPIRTLPRPIQPELNYWVTIAGNPETFEMAGRSGANVLTHLLGQTFEEVEEKIAVYRKARAEAGHPGEGTVTLMLHTFVGEDLDEVREVARAPMKGYLNSAMGLVKQAAWHFPTFKKMSAESGASLDEVYENMSEEDTDALLDYAFERYFEKSGLFGPPERCIEIADRCKGIGVDEIACLIDFGIPSETVLKSLPLLKQVLDGSNPKSPTEPGTATHENDYSIPALIERHGVTHLQCTPSMAQMLVVNDESREALRSLKEMMVGGEAFPVALANELREIVPGKIVNMYGPTETTIWSSTYQLNGGVASVPIGRPIANTDLYNLDKSFKPVPVGLVGELYIGGEGVVRGYHKREKLTADRFVNHPFSDDADARLYRTGDLVRYLSNGDLEILGRVDHQVKIRGYRIELGEIEERILRHPSVREAVVVAREDGPSGLRLVAYTILATPGEPLGLKEIQDHLRQGLPDYMVPSAFVTLDRFPLTPNGKIDRNGLPAPGDVKVVRETEYVAPESNLEETVVAIWQETLNLSEVGIDDNFFDLGGHSILAVQMHAKIRKAIEHDLSLTDIFRFPTIRSLAGFISNGSDSGEAQQKGKDRGEARRELMSKRRGRNRRGAKAASEE